MRECSKFPSERAKPTSAGAVSSADEWMLKDNARPTLGKHPAVLCMVSSSLTDAVLKQSDIKLPGLLPLGTLVLSSAFLLSLWVWRRRAWRVTKPLQRRQLLEYCEGCR